jgi:hypothetical protein
MFYFYNFHNIVRGTPDKINVFARGGDKRIVIYLFQQLGVVKNPLPTSRKDP